jgi:hypothetical protein
MAADHCNIIAITVEPEHLVSPAEELRGWINIIFQDNGFIN